LIRGWFFGSRRETQVQFKVNGQDYFLTFVEDEKRWFVFAPSGERMQRIPVYVDGAKYERLAVLERNTGLVS
jgi:hypothetical protein